MSFNHVHTSLTTLSLTVDFDHALCAGKKKKTKGKKISLDAFLSENGGSGVTFARSGMSNWAEETDGLPVDSKY